MNEKEFKASLAEGERYIDEAQIADPNSDYHWVKTGDYMPLTFSDGTNMVVSMKFWKENGLDKFDYVYAEKHKNRKGMKYEGDTIIFYGKSFVQTEEDESEG